MQNNSKKGYEIVLDDKEALMNIRITQTKCVGSGPGLYSKCVEKGLMSNHHFKEKRIDLHR